MKRKCLFYCINVHRPALNLNNKQPWHIFPHCQSLWCKTQLDPFQKHLCFSCFILSVDCPKFCLGGLSTAQSAGKAATICAVGNKKLVHFVGLISEDLSPAHSTPTGFSGSCWLIHQLPPPLIGFLFYIVFVSSQSNYCTSAYVVPF